MLYAPGFALLKKITNSPSPILNPDRNPILRAIVKLLVYAQSCAEMCRSEILARISQIKCLGYAGQILCYWKEMQVQPSSAQPAAGPLGNESCSSGRDEELDWWKRGNMETLDMLSDGDYLGIKYLTIGDPPFQQREIR
ncbi:MAG: hypothetical protein LQ348_002930 [Seirophora lacunosa]|nr:MAG: hypothetical protein LQ348_002930 [Seirophora lacunosa]